MIVFIELVDHGSLTLVHDCREHVDLAYSKQPRGWHDR
jgi:hypothetical protein